MIIIIKKVYMQEIIKTKYNLIKYLTIPIKNIFLTLSVLCISSKK